MHIVHVSLKSLVMDGWGYQDNLLTKYHKKMGYDVSCITSHWIYDKNGELAEDLRDHYVNDDGVDIYRLAMIGKNDYTRKLMKYKGFYDLLEKLRPDILFIHSVSFTNITELVEYSKSHSNVIAYADNHADFSNSATNWISKNILHKIIWKHYAQRLVPYVKKFYGVLPARVDFLKEMYDIPTDKLELLVMGADDDLVESTKTTENRRMICQKHNIDDRCFLIVTGGKIDEAKTQTLLLMMAVNELSCDNVQLLVFGSISDSLKDKIREQESKYCHYVGWLEGSWSYNYFAAADLVVFPGRHSVYWEQVAGLGVPMICKYWEGTTHVDVGGNCKFLMEDSVQEIYEKLTEIIDNKEVYDEMLKVAVEKGKEMFSYRRIARESIEMLEETR